ncbi:hypothetical protein ABIC30_005972 [Methylobacterium sp. 1030]
MEGEIAGAAGKGLVSLYEYGGMVTILVLVCISLGFALYLQWKRNASMADKLLDTITQNTVAITTLTEVIRANTR